MATTDQQGSEQDVPEVNTSTAPQQDGTADQPEPKGNKEAAKYRRQLRDTETERDALAETVTGLQRQIVASNLPRTANLKADALWVAGRKPGDFFNEEGQLDSDKLTAAVKETHEALGVPMIRLGVVPGSGSGSGKNLWDDEPATLASEARKRQG